MTSRQCGLLVADIDCMTVRDTRTAISSWRIPRGTHVVGLASMPQSPLARVIAHSPRSILLPGSCTPVQLAHALSTLMSATVEGSAIGHKLAPNRGLTPRQIEVLRTVSHGLTNQQVAVELGIAEGTVKRHLYESFVFLGAQSRLDAVNRARARGMISS
ncbi:helix-turn-helix transcriptional regulator [Agromyces larvae]|uniref:helix-turn-helix transcriptional regulator n=1 Tax=Agromyces larvae TaxID=2929802 RepID=UPI00338DEB11